ncbi:MAG: Hsp70 family protein [Caldilineaceae bacterium]
MRIGIDFGTTHTSAAFYDGQTIRAIPLDPRNANPNLLRSMIYITHEQKRFLGLAAVRTFLEQDTGRPVVYQKKVVGTIENTVAQQFKMPSEPDGPITIIYDVIIEEDIGAQGRLLQSIKTGLRSDSYRGTSIFGRYYTVQELIALLLCHVRTQAERYAQTEIHQAVLGRPVQFSNDPAEDQRAEQRLREAAALAGFADVTFVPEPVAAASFYLNQVQQPETVLVFDFGGGTLDLTVMRVDGPQRHEILATHGVLIGGDDLDSRLMQKQVASHFGVNAAIDRNFDERMLAFPEDLAELLNQWQTIPVLSQPQHLAVIRRAKKYSPEPEKFAALESLVTKNHGFALFERIEQAKRVLSTEPQALLNMQVDEIDLALRLTRRNFNLAVSEELSQARQGVREAIAKAGLTASDVNAVVTTGGSSVIPLFQQMLMQEFPKVRLVPLDTFSGVVNGLALHAYRSEPKTCPALTEHAGL